MNAPARLAAYGALLATVFAGSFGAGRTFDAVGLSKAEPVEHGASDYGDGLPGLAIATGDLALVASTRTVTAGQSSPYSFRITKEDGVVTEFDEEQTKRMHLIVVRRDFIGFVHDHPAMAADGTWSTTLTLTEPGAYRVFADFMVDGDKHTLGADLFVPGDFQPVALPTPRASVDAGDGYEVELGGDVAAGKESELWFTVRRNGAVVGDIADYLGAKGHLVALREGDLAYLHVHPDEGRLLFEAEFPTAGRYRLFLQFAHGGQVRTVALTLDVPEER